MGVKTSDHIDVLVAISDVEEKRIEKGNISITFCLKGNITHRASLAGFVR